MANIQPPPTYADVVLNEGGRPRFNPIWLKWFVDLAQIIDSAGGTAVDHNSLTGLQGGNASERYHLLAAERNLVSGVQTANRVFAGPNAGAPAAPTFRVLVAADLPLNFGDSETPAGVINGVNAVFTLANAPSPAASLILTLNGLVQYAGGVSYTLAGNQITYAVAPLVGDVHRAWYRY